MSRSDPPRSGIAERVRGSSPVFGPAEAGPRRTLRRRLGIRLAALMRWLHIYLSMFGLAVILFFSLTGVTLNHPDWFTSGAERSVEAEGTLNPRWLRPVPPAPSGQDVNKLEVVEYLRNMAPEASSSPSSRFSASLITSMIVACAPCFPPLPAPGIAVSSIFCRN